MLKHSMGMYIITVIKLGLNVMRLSIFEMVLMD